MKRHNKFRKNLISLLLVFSMLIGFVPSLNIEAKDTNTSETSTSSEEITTASSTKTKQSTTTTTKATSSETTEAAAEPVATKTASLSIDLSYLKDEQELVAEYDLEDYIPKDYTLLDDYEFKFKEGATADKRCPERCRLFSSFHGCSFFENRICGRASCLAQSELV